MKTVYALAIFAALIAAVVCDHKAELEQLSKACLEEAHVTEAELKQFISNGMKASDANDKIKCHMKCIMEKQGLFQGGNYNDEQAIKMLKEVPQLKDRQAEIEKVVQSCKNEKGANDCDTAFKITMCMKENKAAA